MACRSHCSMGILLLFVPFFFPVFLLEHFLNLDKHEAEMRAEARAQLKKILRFILVCIYSFIYLFFFVCGLNKTTNRSWREHKMEMFHS